MEKPTKRVDRLRIVPDAHPIIDMSYVELPERLTCRINSSSVLGTIAFFAMFFAPAFAEENPLMSLAMGVVMAGYAYLALKEDGQIK